MIEPGDLGGDEDRARLVLVQARYIAPCIDSLADDSEARKDAIAILKDVLAGMPAAGARHIKSERAGTSAVEYVTGAATFSAEHRTALRSLCGAASTAGLPVGDFPKPDRAVSALWPEERC